jgi:TyrR family helix-turn-helix protein/PAS domain S-box-containing protein
LDKDGSKQIFKWGSENLIELIDVGVMVVDEQGYIKYLNKFSEKIFKTTFEKVGDNHASTLLPHSGILDVLEFGEENHHFSMVNNLTLFIHTKPLNEKHQQVFGAVSVFYDISTMHNFDFETKDLDEKMNVIFNHISDGIMVCDANGKILSINNAYENLFGVKREEAVGIYVYDFAHRFKVPDTVESYVIESKLQITKEIELPRMNKKVEVISIPVFKKNNHLHRIISRVREVSHSESTSSVKAPRDLPHLPEKSKWIEQNEFMKNIIANSPAMRNVIVKASHVASVDTNVLILGESGVGKEVVTEVIHKISDRRNGPLIKINCGAIPETLLESELFGYEKGSFTGANEKGKIGLFEVAQGGTIFLDEIGEIPLHLQVKLLRAIQQREIMRVGGTKTIKLDVRLIAATNRDLEQMVEEGKFREDLYYRINVVPIQIPPLRDRKEDIAELALHFLAKFNKQYKQIKKMSSDAMETLIDYSWPGNVRQLENLMEQLVVMSSTELIDVVQLPSKILRETKQQPVFNVSQKDQSLKEIMSKYEKEVLKEMLKVHKTIRKTAVQLKMDHSTIVRKLQKYEIHFEEIV